MIKYIIFDMGGVLVKSSSKISRSPTKSAFFMLAEMNKINFQDLMDFVDSAEKDLMNGTINEHKFFGRIRKRFHINRSPKELDRMLVRYYEKFDRIDRDVFRIFRVLRKRYPVGLITDVYPMHVKRRKEKGMYRMFDHVVTSLDAKQSKAEGKQGIYKIMLKKLKAKPQECVFIDDKRKNLAAPRKLGIKTIHFRNALQLKKDLKKMGVEGTL